MGRATWALIILNVVAFEIVFSMPDPLFGQAFGLLSYSSPKLIELWRMVTSLFLHASASHLFFNMLGLYFFGRIAEKELKGGKFVALYFVSGFAGNLAFGLFSGEPAVGASGCVFGLMGFAMFLKPKEIITMYVIPLPLGIVAILFAAVESMLAYFGEMASGVAHVAHVAGLALGIAAAFLFNPEKSGKGFLWLALFAILILAMGSVFGLVIDIGNFLLDVVDAVVGFFLYGLAKIIGSLLWPVLQ
jgi:membrane associated rhomboid family serine protease